MASQMANCYDIRLYFFSFLLFNQLYYYCSHVTDTFLFVYCFCLPLTPSDSLPIRYCDSVLVFLFLTHIDSYLTVTQDESSTVFDSQ